MNFKRFSTDRLKEIRSVLIIGLSSIGDNLLISPSIRLIKEKCKNAEIDFVVGPRAFVFAEKNPVFSNVYIWDKKTGLKNLIKMLGGKKYDLIVDFRNSLIPLFLRSEYKLFFFKELFSKKFSTHETVRVMKYLEPYFGKTEIKGLYFPLCQEELQTYCKDFINLGITEKESFIVFNPGAAFEKKRWDKHRFIETGKQIILRYGLKIVVVGSMNEIKLAQEITEKINHKNALNLAGKITFRQLAYLLSNALLLITNDTGTMHLASATRCPVIAIFGPGNPLRYGPIGTPSIVLHTDRNCFPCRLESRCNKNFVCMQDVTTEMVIYAVEKMLNLNKN